MTPAAAVVDTNVVVARLITGNASAPTARILDGMRRGAFPFLISEALLAEYREVLLRPEIRRRHGLAATEVDRVLAEIATHAIVREPKDDHLWSLVMDLAGAALVTGDLALAHKPPPG